MQTSTVRLVPTILVVARISLSTPDLWAQDVAPTPGEGELQPRDLVSTTDTPGDQEDVTGLATNPPAQAPQAAESPSNAGSEAPSIGDEAPGTSPSDPAPEATAGPRQDGDPQQAPEHEHPPPPVLRYGSIELRPDLTLFLAYQMDLQSEDEFANSFRVTRGYIGFKLRLTSWLSARLTYDLSQVTDLGRLGPAPVTEDPETGETTAEVDSSSFNGSFAARLKYAYLDFGISRLSMSVRFGLVHTPWLDWIEHIELGRVYRHVMMEELYHYPSADFGLVLVGNITDYVSYHVGIVNGEGYHGIESARFKDLVGRVSIRPLPRVRGFEALQLTGYVQAEVAVPDADEEETARRFGGALTYRLVEEVLSPDCRKVRGERFALWAQFFYGQRGPSDDLTDQLGMSFGARVELPYNLFVFARADRFDFDMDQGDDNYWRFLGAFGIRPLRGVSISLNYQGRIGNGEDHLLGLHAELHL